MSSSPESREILSRVSQELKDNQPRRFTISNHTIIAALRALPEHPQPFDQESATTEALKGRNTMPEDLHYSRVTLLGSHIDTITTHLVPYANSTQREAYLDTLVNEAAQRRHKGEGDLDDQEAYGDFMRIRIGTTLDLWKASALQFNEAWEQAGGKRRQSFIERIKLFELEEA